MEFFSGGGDGIGKHICKSFVKMIDSAALTSSLNTWILHLGTKYIKVLLFSVPLGKTFQLYLSWCRRPPSSLFCATTPKNSIHIGGAAEKKVSNPPPSVSLISCPYRLRLNSWWLFFGTT